MTDINSFKSYSIHKNTPVPLYYQFKNILLDMLEKDILKTGDMIPTEVELCSVFDISRTTIRQAITDLVNEKKLHRIKGKGTFVLQKKITQDFIRRIESYKDEMTRKGYIPSSKVLEKSVLLSNEEVSKALRISSDTKVIRLKRLRFANSHPIVITDTYLPYSVCSHIMAEDMSNASLYNILSRKTDTQIHRIVKNIEAVVPTEEDCLLLEISETTAIQLFQYTAYNKYDRPIEYTVSRYRGDRNIFTVEQSEN